MTELAGHFLVTGILLMKSYCEAGYLRKISEHCSCDSTQEVLERWYQNQRLQLFLKYDQEWPRMAMANMARHVGTLI